MGVVDRICETRHVPSFLVFPVPAVRVTSEALPAAVLFPGPHENVSSRPVIPNLGYAYLQGNEPGHLGVREKIE
jgi:hypothetical protein